MFRRMLLVPLMGVALSASVGILGGAGKGVEIVKYPVPGSEDAVGEVDSEASRKVLDDFYKSHVLDDVHRSAVTNDSALTDSLLADHVVWVSERLGIGESLTKAQVLADIRSSHLHMNSHQHDHVRLVAFGDTVVVTGRSTSVLHYGGQEDKGPRVLVEVWTKQNGRWRMVAHVQADAANGTTRGFQ